MGVCCDICNSKSASNTLLSTNMKNNLREQYAAEEQVYHVEVEAIWSKYDWNGNGQLDKEEAFAFLRDSL